MWGSPSGVNEDPCLLGYMTPCWPTCWRILPPSSGISDHGFRVICTPGGWNTLKVWQQAPPKRRHLPVDAASYSRRPESSVHILIQANLHIRCWENVWFMWCVFSDFLQRRRNCSELGRGGGYCGVQLGHSPRCPTVPSLLLTSTSRATDLNRGHDIFSWSMYLCLPTRVHPRTS